MNFNYLNVLKIASDFEILTPSLDKIWSKYKEAVADKKLEIANQ
jgi:hypothetical protein